MISDKLSSVLQWLDEVLLHVSRGVRWDSDHVVTLTDELQAIAAEAVRGDYLDRVRFGLDYFDASINRVAAWVVGTRALLKAILIALLEPIRLLRRYEAEGDLTARLALLEEAKALPWGAIWDYYCTPRVGAGGAGLGRRGPDLRNRRPRPPRVNTRVADGARPSSNSSASPSRSAASGPCEGVSFDLRAGEVHALVGENGAGKSTLIRVITGAHAPDSGSIVVAGREFDRLDPALARQLGIAAIYQQPALFPDLSVAENIALALEPPGGWRWSAGASAAIEPGASSTGSARPSTPTPRSGRSRCPSNNSSRSPGASAPGPGS